MKQRGTILADLLLALAIFSFIVYLILPELKQDLQHLTRINNVQ